MGDTAKTAPSVAEILRQLALGNDPPTGLPVAAEHLHHRPDIIRALMLAREAVDGTRRGELRSNQRAGAPWSDLEDKELADMFHQGESVTSIAKSFQRSTGSITSRLAKLEILDDVQVVLEDARTVRRE